MDYFEGSVAKFNLIEHENNQQELKTFYELALKMFKAVRSLHEIGYIHRDIKPENFRIHQDKAMIIDLGSCK